MSIDGPFYHGTTGDDAESLVTHGVKMGRTQRRDRGFFGDGFYVAARPDTAKDYGSAVVEVHTVGADVFHAGETFPEGSSIIPQGQPSWHGDFLSWAKSKVADRWKDRWEGTFKPKLTPGSASFDRQNWYREVTDYAADRGYDIVYWTESEIVIRNANTVSRVEMYEKTSSQ